MRRPISKKLRFAVLSRDGFRCRYCGAGPEEQVLHIDHRVPVALGGTNDIDNLVTACLPCNLGKSATMADLDDGLDMNGMPWLSADGWPQDIEDPVYFLNGEWAVTGFGLESVRTFYAISADDLNHVVTYGAETLSMWLAHMPSKKWVFRNADAFLEAFLKALRAHQVTPKFDLPVSVQHFRHRTMVGLIRDQDSIWDRPKFDADLDDEEGSGGVT